jgi:hypothetical protein
VRRKGEIILTLTEGSVASVVDKIEKAVKSVRWEIVARLTVVLLVLMHKCNLPCG